MRMFRSPAVRFAALGLLLFAVKSVILPARVERLPLVITTGRITQLRAEFERTYDRLPSPKEERALVDRAVEEEILYREALARGLDRNDSSIAFRLTEKMRFFHEGDTEGDDPIDLELYRQARDSGLDLNDPVVRRIVVQKMKLLLARRADQEPPTESELRSYYDRHRDQYTQPARISFWHILIGRNDDPAELLEQLRSDRVAPEAVRLGQPFPLGRHLQGQSAGDLANVFGVDFAAGVTGLEPGRWSGPVRSAHGRHLVWIEAKREGRTPRFETVRARVFAELRAERRQETLQEALRGLRRLYVVRVEKPAEAQQS